MTTTTVTSTTQVPLLAVNSLVISCLGSEGMIIVQVDFLVVQTAK
jgi:hypothetical protein